MNKRKSNLATTIGVLVAVLFCCGITILTLTGILKGAVNVVSAVIDQGPAAIVVAILALLFGPDLIIITIAVLFIIGVSVWIGFSSRRNRIDRRFGR